jgi:hypothetical protein
MKMNWDHRVCKIVLPDGSDYYQIKEVYYKAGTRSKTPTIKSVDGWSEGAATVAGDRPQKPQMDATEDAGSR